MRQKGEKMGRLIDAIQLKIAIAYSNIIEDGKTLEQIIDEQPTIEPELIRCKDCKHYDGRPCGKVDWYNSADDFCSRAERREDA